VGEAESFIAVPGVTSVAVWAQSIIPQTKQANSGRRSLCSWYPLSHDSRRRQIRI